MRLAELERAVQEHVLAGGALPAALAAAVAPPAEERWRVYSEAYRLRLIEALAAQYPALAARLGEERFAARLDAFVTAAPSRFRSVRDYGGELGAFLRAEAAGTEDEMLAELAEFEWQIAAAFDAAAAAATAPGELGGVAPEEWPALRFRCVPAVRRLRTLTNAVEAYRAHSAEPPPASGPAAIRTAPTEWLIHRPEFTPQYRPLAPGEAAALDALAAGASFGALCERLGEELGAGAAPQAAAWLKGWLLEGILQKV